MTMIIGCDFHPSFQQIAYLDQESGYYGEQRLGHREEAASFYRSLAGRGVRVGMEATGNDRWFRKLLSEAGHELLIGDASAIHASARASSEPISVMRGIFCGCWWRIVFHRFGSRRQPTRNSASCCCIAAGWCGCGQDQEPVGLDRQERGADWFAQMV